MKLSKTQVGRQQRLDARYTKCSHLHKCCSSACDRSLPNLGLLCLCYRFDVRRRSTTSTACLRFAARSQWHATCQRWPSSSLSTTVGGGRVPPHRQGLQHHRHATSQVHAQLQIMHDHQQPHCLVLAVASCVCCLPESAVHVGVPQTSSLVHSCCLMTPRCGAGHTFRPEACDGGCIGTILMWCSQCRLRLCLC